MRWCFCSARLWIWIQCGFWSDVFCLFTQKRATAILALNQALAYFGAVFEEKLLPFRLKLVGSFGCFRLLGQLARPEHVRTAGTAHPNWTPSAGGFIAQSPSRPACYQNRRPQLPVPSVVCGSIRSFVVVFHRGKFSPLALSLSLSAIFRRSLGSELRVPYSICCVLHLKCSSWVSRTCSGRLCLSISLASVAVSTD